MPIPRNRAHRGHNGGPPLEEPRHRSPWGKGDPYRYCQWKKAHKQAWRSPPAEIRHFRSDKAERLGLTYEEYTLEILERGRHLQVEDGERIAVIKAGRRRRSFHMTD